MSKQKVLTPQEVAVDRSGTDVVLHIRGAGALTIPRDPAYHIAREIMRVIGEIDAMSPPGQWPHLKTKQ